MDRKECLIMKKILYFFLSMFLLLNIINMGIIRINASAEDNTSEYATVKVITNNTSEKIVEGAETGADIKTKKEKKTTLIKKNNKIYMSLDDICEFTRTNKEKTDNKYILRQGLQEITVLIEDDGNSKLKSLYGDFNIQTVTENNKVYCEPEPLMSMLFAEYTYYDDTLLIDLPQYTVYEAINFDYSKYQSDVLSFGIDENTDNMGTAWIKWGFVVQRTAISLSSDIFVDSNYGFFATDNATGQYYYEAFNEILGYDIYSDKSVIEEETKIYEKINDLGSFLEKTQGGDISDTPFTDFYISSYIDSYAKKGLKDNNSLSVFNDTIRDLSTNGRVNEKLNSYLNQSGKDVLTNILFNSALEYVKRSSYDRKVLKMFKILYSEDTVNKYNISLNEKGQFIFQCARDYYNSCGSFNDIVKEVTIDESINKFSEMIIKGLFSVTTAGKSQEVFETYETVLTYEKLRESNSSFKPIDKINNSAKYFWLANMQYTTVLTLDKISKKAKESLNSEDMANLVSNFDFYNRISAVMIKTLSDSYQLPTTTKREKDLIANSQQYINELCQNVYKLECCEYNLPIKEELNNKNCDVFNNFFSKQPIELTANHTAVDLIDKSIPEIISLMNGEYQIIQTEMGGYYNGTYNGIFYIQNQSVFPGMEFYVETLLNESIDFKGGQSTGEEIQSDELRRNLEAGKYALDVIQVNKSGKATDSISADMDYIECSKALDNFDCIQGNGGYIGGSPLSALYTYNEKNAKIELHFIATSEMFNAFRLSENNKLSSEQMKSFNPSIMNIVIRKPNETEQTTPPTESPTEPPTGTQTEPTSELKIETGKLSDSDIKSEWQHVLSLDFEYPIFTTSDNSLKDFLDTSITNEILSYMATDSDYNLFISGGFEYDMSIDGYLSIDGWINNHPEGGQGYLGCENYTFFVDLKNRKVLSLKDLFSESEDLVYNEIREKAYNYSDKNVVWESSLSNYDYENCKFLLNKDKLTLIFSPYEISTGVVGSVEIEIPVSDINLTCVIPGVETNGF